MDNFCDVLRQAFSDIFSIFGLGTRKNSTSILHYLFLITNSSVVLTIMIIYILNGKFLISSDALSQATDVIDLFFPVLVHVIVMVNFMFNQKTFDVIHQMMEYFDKTFKTLNPKFFKLTKKSSILGFLLKFLCAHAIGLGIDIFMLIT